jgi:hypothetical protein
MLIRYLIFGVLASLVVPFEAGARQHDQALLEIAKGSVSAARGRNLEAIEHFNDHRPYYLRFARICWAGNPKTGHRHQSEFTIIGIRVTGA